MSGTWVLTGPYPSHDTSVTGSGALAPTTPCCVVTIHLQGECKIRGDMKLVIYKQEVKRKINIYQGRRRTFH